MYRSSISRSLSLALLAASRRDFFATGFLLSNGFPGGSVVPKRANSIEPAEGAFRDLCGNRLFGTQKTPTPNEDSLRNLVQPIPDSYRLVSPSAHEIALQEGQRLVCIGDVHGDFNALQEFLQIANVFDGKQWIGGNTILVQTGDVLDRGSEELACIELLSLLSQQAAQEDGAIILLWGNHEAMNTYAAFQYATDDEEYEREIGRPILDQRLLTGKWRLQFGCHQPARWATFEPGGLLSEVFLSQLKVAVKVGQTLCVHAGLTESQLQSYGGIEGMNTAAQEWIKGVHYGPNNNLGVYDDARAVVESANRRAYALRKSIPPMIGGEIGEDNPVWMRTYSYPADVPPKDVIGKKNTQDMMDDALKAVKADRMVMGHTVQRQINCALNGKAWRIDIGASKGVASGQPEVLEVIMKDGKEVVSVLTRSGQKIPEQDRHLVAVPHLF